MAGELCSVCGKNEAAQKCDECGVLLCSMCTKEVTLQKQHPSAVMKPDVPLSTLRSPFTKKKVCAKCMATVDWD